MTRLLLLICVGFVVGCHSVDKGSNTDPPESLFVQAGRFDPKRGFSGYEAYNIYVGDAKQVDDDLKATILDIRADRQSDEVISLEPDITVEAFSLGQESGGDRYGIWIDAGLLARVEHSNQQDSLDRFAVYRVDVVSIENLRNILKILAMNPTRAGL